MREKVNIPCSLPYSALLSVVTPKPVLLEGGDRECLVLTGYVEYEFEGETIVLEAA